VKPEKLFTISKMTCMWSLWQSFTSLILFGVHANTASLSWLVNLLIRCMFWSTRKVVEMENLVWWKLNHLDKFIKFCFKAIQIKWWMMLVFHIYPFGRCFNINCIKGIFYKFPGIKPMILALAPWSTLWTVEILINQSQFKKKECISISGQPSPFNFNGIW